MSPEETFGKDARVFLLLFFLSHVLWCISVTFKLFSFLDFLFYLGAVVWSSLSFLGSQNLYVKKTKNNNLYCYDG